MKISRIETTEQKDEKKPKGIKHWVKVFFKYKWNNEEKEMKSFWSPSFIDIVKVSRKIADAEEKTYPQKDGFQGKKMMATALEEIIKKEHILEQDIIDWKKKYKFLKIDEELIEKIEEPKVEQQVLVISVFNCPECKTQIKEYENVGISCPNCKWCP